MEKYFQKVQTINGLTVGVNLKTSDAISPQVPLSRTTVSDNGCCLLKYILQRTYVHICIDGITIMVFTKIVINY